MAHSVRINWVISEVRRTGVNGPEGPSRIEMELGPARIEVRKWPGGTRESKGRAIWPLAR